MTPAPGRLADASGSGDFTGFWRDIGRAYDHRIVDAGKEQAFWVLVSFVLTFVVVRVITHAIRAGRGPFGNVSVGNVHLHHLVPGIILVIVTGYLANALQVRTGRTIVAGFFGVGAALTLDEFALWLHLEDVYWSKQGRRSIDAVVIASCIGGLLLLDFHFWRDVGQALGHVF